MSHDEWVAFASHGTRTGKLATVRADGSPHVAPVWFLLDQRDGVDHVVFTTGANTLKGKALRRDPRFSMCVDDEAPPFSFLVLHAEAELSEDPDELLTWATRLGARYMGAAAAEDFGRRNAVPGELLVLGRVTKVVAQAEVAD